MLRMRRDVSDQMSSASPAERTVSSSLATAVAALHEAAEELSRTNGGSLPEPMTDEEEPAASDPQMDEREAYYRSLQRRGALVDADEDVDLASLPPTVTHVRFTNGRVQRIGFN